MNRRVDKAVAGMVPGVGGLVASWGVAAQGQVNVICSVQAEGCSMIATVYARTTGANINPSLKDSGQALAQYVSALRLDPACCDAPFGHGQKALSLRAPPDRPLEKNVNSLPR